MIDVMELDNVLNFYIYDTEKDKFLKLEKVQQDISKHSIIHFKDILVVVTEKDWLTKKAKVGKLSEMLFEKYLEHYGWGYLYTADNDDSKGYDFEVCIGNNERYYYEVKTLGKNNSFFMSITEIRKCIEIGMNYKLFLVKKYGDIYKGYIVDTPCEFLNLNKLHNKLVDENDVIIDLDSIKVVLADNKVNVCKQVIFQN